MPEYFSLASPRSSAPRLVVSRAADERTARSRRSVRSRSRARPIASKTLRSDQEQSSNEWEDVDESRLRERKHYRPSPSRPDSYSIFKAPSRDRSYRRDIATPEKSRHDSTPSLRSEATYSSDRSSRSSGRRSVQRGHHERSSTRRREHPVSIPHRSTRYTTGTGLRMAGLQTLSPSMLSVTTSATKSTDRSSGSGSTITQESHRRRGSQRAQLSNGKPKQNGAATSTEAADASRSPSSSVAPSTDQYRVDADADDGSDSSSSGSSGDEASDAGSSDSVDTPSSRSTVPSPATTRSHSVSDRRWKSALQHSATLNGSKRNISSGPESIGRASTKAPEVDDIREDDENAWVTDPDPIEAENRSRRRSSSRSSRPQRAFTDQLWQQEEAMRQHLARMHHHHPETSFDRNSQPPHSPSMSSAHPAASSYGASPPPHMAMQHYQWPIHAPAMSQSIHEHTTLPAAPSHPYARASSPQDPIPPQHRPPPAAPEAPDLSQRTIEGYEQLALELANPTSPVKPLYRKFAYLHHRILLHLQDELSELEEQLRVFDELLAQNRPLSARETVERSHHALEDSAAGSSSISNTSDGGSSSDNGTNVPPKPRRPAVSRRAEATHGTEMHLQRTHLLGRIFIKTEQYSRAMAAFAGLERDCTAAALEDVRAYREWMRVNAPVHECERRFLDFAGDLVEAGSGSSAAAASPSRGISSRESSTTAAGVDLGAGKSAAAIAGKTKSQAQPSSSEISSRQMLLAVGLPVALMLSLLLFALIPGFMGRLVAVAGFTFGGWGFAVACPGLREVLPDRKWAVCGAGLVVVLGVLAAWVP